MKALMMCLLMWLFAAVGGNYYGELTVRPDRPFKMEKVRVQVDGNVDKGSVTVKIYKVRFSKMMPVRLDITIPGVKVVKNGNGYSLSGNGIVPSNGNKAYPSRMVRNLKGSMTGDQLYLEMTMGEAPLRYKGTK